jgi:3-methyl-2-oxobutanoate hydroxymethyltransferase
VLECVPAKLAEYVTSILDIPTIGIGAGAGCDGQVLVYQDMLGMFSDYTPKFVKKYADAGTFMRQAFTDYINETKSGAFPSEEHCFKIDEDVMEKVMEEEK